VRVDLGVISEDLRQRVLTAIASELERDEAERLRNAPEQDGAGGRGSYGAFGAEQATGSSHAAAAGPANGAAGPANGSADALAEGAVDLGDGAAELADIGPATSYEVSPANGSGAHAGNGSGASLANGGSTGWDNLTSSGTGASPEYAPPWDRDAPWERDVPLDRDALWPGSPAQPGDTPDDEAADRGHGAAEEAAAAQAAAATAAGEQAPGAEDATDGPGEAASRPAVPLPRRAPGTNGAPPPPAGLRREYLPPSLLGRRLDPEAHTEPLPRISATGPGPGGPATGSDQSAPSIFSPTSRSAPPAAPVPAGSPAGPEAAVPEAAAPGPGGAAPPGEPAAPVPPEAPSAEAMPPDSAAPRPAASAAALAAASAPTMPVGSAALTAASAATMPAGSAALAAAAGSAPPAETAHPEAGPAHPAPPSADLAGPPAAPPADLAAPSPVTSPPPLPAPPTSVRSRPPAASLPAPSGYGWPESPGGPRPRTGRGAGPVVPLPAALPARRSQGSGRPYRIAGVILAVVALVVAGVIALVLSGGSTPRHGSGLGPPARGAGALVRRRAAAWVSGQVSRAAVVACDPVMCQALMTHGVAANRLYQLGAQTTSPLRSQVIVATAAVRAQFGNVLSSVYAPAVLASFGAGADRVDIRATAQHGAAAYRALLGSDMASRRAIGTQLLRSGRIAAAAAARRELAAGDVDGRLLIAIAQMAAAHPMFIVDFGSPAPGADPDMPLRQADLAEDAHAHHRAGRVVSAGYVQEMLSFLRAQHGPFRPARVQTMRLPDGAAVLRIEFTAPSPLGLLGPHA
jgi:hypothetical protein